MLAVVDAQFGAIGQRPVQAARPATSAARGFEQGAVVTGFAQMHGRRQAGPAGADDGDTPAGPGAVQRVPTQVRHAIHSLRSGVRVMRWCST